MSGISFLSSLKVKNEDEEDNEASAEALAILGEMHTALATLGKGLGAYNFDFILLKNLEKEV